VRITEGSLGGQVNWTSFAVGAGTLAAILLLKPYKRIPGLLLAVVAATIVVGILNLDYRWREGSRAAAPRAAIVCLPMISFAHLTTS
jgi:Sulfate permease and related transporters (MFS superfamily)